MEQKEIRKWNNEQYSAVEGAELIEELDNRTKSALAGYNSIADLGAKVKEMEETGVGKPGEDGADGLSAYEIAVREGFVGTETDWVESLKGIDGDSGSSAYQVAVSNGFIGTEAEWLESIKGQPGADGQDGTTDISPKWVEVTANRNLLPTDIGKILYNRGATNVVITIPSDIALGITEDVAFTAWQEGAGRIKVRGSLLDGVTANPIQTIAGPTIEPISYTRRGVNNWKGVKGEPWIAYSQMNVGPNAASDPNGNESNAITGFSSNNSLTTITATSDAFTGAYAILGTLNTDLNASAIVVSFSALAGDVFRVSYAVKSGQGVNQRVSAWQNCTGGPTSDVVTSTWTTAEYTITAIANGLVQLRFYVSVNSSGLVGDQILVDDLSIIKIN